MSFFKFLVSSLTVPFTSVFLLKWSCPLRKPLLFEWNQSRFSFLSQPHSSEPEREVGILLGPHWQFPNITTSSFCKHLAHLKLALSGCTPHSLTSLLYPPIFCQAFHSVKVLALVYSLRVLSMVIFLFSPKPLIHYFLVIDHFPPIFTSWGLISHGNMVVTIFNVYWMLSKCWAHCLKGFTCLHLTHHNLMRNILLFPFHKWGNSQGRSFKSLFIYLFIYFANNPHFLSLPPSHHCSIQAQPDIGVTQSSVFSLLLPNRWTLLEEITQLFRLLSQFNSCSQVGTQDWWQAYHVFPQDSLPTLQDNYFISHTSLSPDDFTSKVI